jgi:hypothetical protein
MLVIGLGHRARHGKDTVARMLLGELYRTYKDPSFYAALYSLASDFKGWARIQGYMTEKNPPFLQQEGDVLRRYKSPTIFVDALRWRLKEEQPTVAIIPDVRLGCDVSLVQEMGGFCFKVARLHNGKPWYSDTRDPDHPTEACLDGWLGWQRQYTIETGDVDGLHAVALDIKSFIQWKLNGNGKGHA